jgi:capsular exopolysaccharide synthesis family protein
MNITPHDPRAYLKVFWRWKWLFLACVIAVPGIAYLITSRQTKVYQSSVLIQEGALPVDTSLFPSSTSGAAPAGTASSPVVLGGEARVIETPAVADLAAPHLKPAPSNPSMLLNHITATPNTKTGFITIVGKASDPNRAADIANAFGAAVVQLRTRQAARLLGSTISRVQIQLAHMSQSDKVGRSQLSAQLQQLRTIRDAQNSNAQVLQPAVASSSPVSPKVAKAVALGVVGGLLLGFGIVFLAEAADRRIRHPEDLEELTGLPLLAVIPKSAFSETAADVRTHEAFHTLRSALMFFNVDRPLSAIVIASPLKGDGKTTVATGLAVAAAQAGRDVILVDADLRRPQAASRLHVTGEAVSPGHGLAAVLTAQSSLQDALTEVLLRAEGEEDPPFQDELMKGRLRLLPAGGTPPNPSELLASQRMRELMHEVREISDLVVIDSNPLLAVSDSLPLLDSASGAVLVSRLNFTTKEAVRRFQKTITNTNASVLGVVATGGRGSLRYGYGYGYGYGYAATAAANGNGTGGRRRRLLGVGRNKEKS